MQASVQVEQDLSTMNARHLDLGLRYILNMARRRHTVLVRLHYCTILRKAHSVTTFLPPSISCALPTVLLWVQCNMKPRGPGVRSRSSPPSVKSSSTQQLVNTDSALSYPYPDLSHPLFKITIWPSYLPFFVCKSLHLITVPILTFQFVFFRK